MSLKRCCNAVRECSDGCSQDSEVGENDRHVFDLWLDSTNFLVLCQDFTGSGAAVSGQAAVYSDKVQVEAVQ